MAEAFSNVQDILTEQDTFGDREVGITHPDLTSFVRLLDNGDIEIVAKDGLGIILSAASQSITFIAEAIRFLTRDSHGLVWNQLSFNSQATTFSQPAFRSLSAAEMTQMFEGVENFFPTTG